MTRTGDAHLHRVQLMLTRVPRPPHTRHAGISDQDSLGAVFFSVPFKLDSSCEASAAGSSPPLLLLPISRLLLLRLTSNYDLSPFLLSPPLNACLSAGACVFNSDLFGPFGIRITCHPANRQKPVNSFNY